MPQYNPKAKQTIANLHFGNIGIKKIRDAMGTMSSTIVDEMYQDIIAEDGFVYSGGKTTCASGWIKDINGVCQPITAVPVSNDCGAGWVMDFQGVCQPANPMPIPRVCPDGYTKDANGNCIIVINNLSDACLPGYYTEKDSTGKCLPIPIVVAVGERICPDGYKRVGNDCVNEKGGALLNCPAGYVADANQAGKCVPMPASTCPAGYTRDLTKGGLCVAIPKVVSPPLFVGGGGATTAPKTTTEPITPVVTPTPTVAKKDKDKMKWVFIGVGVLLIAVVTAYFIVKP